MLLNRAGKPVSPRRPAIPHLVSIAYSPAAGDTQPPDHYQRVPVTHAALTVAGGLAGDRKGRHPDRQLNVMTREVLDALAAEGYHTAPGQMGEQLVVSGLNLNALAPGDRVQLGPQAIIEIIKPRTGCDRFEAIQKLTRRQAAGRMGQMCRVIVGGPLAVGDDVRVLVAEPGGAPV
ncbi:MAG: MOSC domain-containing protein [Anaerolineales bacterium]|nr:MOSC domain-containing protein [Anaerolineales bacterium]